MSISSAPYHQARKIGRRRAYGNPYGSARAARNEIKARNELIDLTSHTTSALSLQFHLQPFEQDELRRIAARNVTKAQFAKEIGMHDPVGIDVYISESATRLIRQRNFLGAPLKPAKTRDRTTNQDYEYYDAIWCAISNDVNLREISESGGASIGGSIIEGEKRFGKTEGSTFGQCLRKNGRRVKPITSFDDKTGKIIVKPPKKDDYETVMDDLYYSDETSAKPPSRRVARLRLQRKALIGAVRHAAGTYRVARRARMSEEDGYEEESKA